MTTKSSDEANFTGIEALVPSLLPEGTMKSNGQNDKVKAVPSVYSEEAASLTSQLGTERRSHDTTKRVESEPKQSLRWTTNERIIM